jgi:hypothetical protein
MSQEDPTKTLIGDANGSSRDSEYLRVLTELMAKIDALDAKVEARLYDTRPLWEGVQTQISGLRAEIEQSRAQTEAGFRTTDHRFDAVDTRLDTVDDKLDILNKNALESQAKINRRLRDLEERPS